MHRFPGKILLFGEHIILQGATALAVPVWRYGGQWAFATAPGDNPACAQLQAVARRLSGDLPLNLDALRRDLEQHLYFDANIPQGYGMGSSGALTAALYDRYGTTSTNDPAALKRVLGEIESTFHGKSSGIDPLTSYLGRALLIQHKTEVTPLATFAEPEGITTFLIDTRQPRTTGTLVQWFIHQCEHPDWSAQLHQRVLPIHENMVAAWLNGHSESFFTALHEISEWQHLTLQPMLPTQTAILDWWDHALRANDTRLKICGAGGGGFVLGFTKNKHAALEMAQKTGYPVIFPFEQIA
jgi:mevalonate kinase